jgi:hypothetical protein
MLAATRPDGVDLFDHAVRAAEPAQASQQRQVFRAQFREREYA